MKIKFKQVDDEHILIIGVEERNGTGKLAEEKEIGHIFTPSGSGETNLNAIQICGFDEAFDLWGCGVYGDKKRKVMKKDIQLAWFGLYDQMSDDEISRVVTGQKEHKLTPELKKMMKTDRKTWTEKTRVSRFGFDGKICEKCFNHPCTCEILTNHENPYTVKREQDLWLERKKK